ncbi:MAG TPA: helix-turn-helix transcriptional regulator [Bryobacteraceae bacterium]|nr:helix-turn-helix transcriptional regulator [Bryobacteraceae bacterium]
MANEIDFKRLGHAIRFQRQGHGWGLAELASKSGISKAYISDLENGVAGKPNVQHLYSIAKALDVTLDELVNGAVEESVSVHVSARSRQLPPGLAELKAELCLSDEDALMLASVNFRGHRPRDKEGWRYLLETLRMLSQRKTSK